MFYTNSVAENAAKVQLSYVTAILEALKNWHFSDGVGAQIENSTSTSTALNYIGQYQEAGGDRYKVVTVIDISTNWVKVD